ncbi:MAG: GNAT family N-acetyltransferase [Bacteroidetes bacterium]|nr:GNAT family N-acetyltransferase [Bacteroidota bacterium]
MNIRKGTINDVQLLHTIGVKTFDDTFGGTCTKEDMKFVLDKFFNLAQCKIDLQDENDNFYFLEEDGIVKGYIRINDIHEYPLEELKPFKCIELVRLYVLKEYHGTSVATDLMQFAFDFARERNYEKMYLSVWEYNFRARGFYEKIGFVNTGKEKKRPHVVWTF